MLSTSAACQEEAVVVASASRVPSGAPQQPTAASAHDELPQQQQQQLGERAPTMRFVSSHQREQRRPSDRRLPICFPDITLEMMKLPPDQMQQLRETGWLREVAFKTAPHVTKLEIAAYLSSVYGMDVERVSTINYLGRKRLTAVGRASKMVHWREDDWKKAYVLFRPPPGMEHLMEQQQQRERRQLRAGRRGERRDGEVERGGEVVEAEEGAEEGRRPLVEAIREADRAPGRPRWNRLTTFERLKRKMKV